VDNLNSTSTSVTISNTNGSITDTANSNTVDSVTNTTTIIKPKRKERPSTKPKPFKCTVCQQHFSRSHGKYISFFFFFFINFKINYNNN